MMRIEDPVLLSLAQTPELLARTFALVPAEGARWIPPSWEGIPGERFPALGQLCHVRDIERDGYLVRFRRVLEEEEPDLVSIDGDALAIERGYEHADAGEALESFRAARLETLAMLQRVTDAELRRTATFAEYGRVTLRGLMHFLLSHDQQHLACLHWLIGQYHSR